VEAALDVEPGADALLQELAPLGREATALRRHTHDRNRGSERERVLDRPDHGNAVVLLPCSPRVEDRDDRVRAVADDTAHRLAVVRVVRETLPENEESTRASLAHAGETPSPGPSEGI